jgi:hypothetical protein
MPSHSPSAICLSIGFGRVGRKAIASVAIAVLAGVSCNRSSDVASRMGRDAAALNNPLFAVSGIYPDGWMAPDSSVQLGQPPGANTIHFRGIVPDIGNPEYRTYAEFRLDDKPIALRPVAVGLVDLHVPVPKAAGRHKISVRFADTQILPGADRRQVGARLESMAFEELDPGKLREPQDIASFGGIRLESGWGPIETFQGERFRWVENDAELNLEAVSDSLVMLTILMEPGPGAAGRTQLLRILDKAGQQIGTIVLDRRETVRLGLDLRAPGSRLIRLHREGAGVRTAVDSRVLNFRVFAVGAAPLARGTPAGR